jgi:hypothetical protein
MKVFLSLLVTLLLSSSLWGQSFDPGLFDRVDAFLQTYVQDGRVAYTTLAKTRALDPLVAEIGKASLSGQDAATQQAFLINAYNLLVIHSVVQHLPLHSVLDVEGFFNQATHLVAGERLTLDQVEKQRLLKAYGDARFHFVLVCGAVGCPPLTRVAYRPDQLAKQLSQQTHKAMNDPQFIRVDEAAQQVQLSHIFDWYSSDFGGSKREALSFVNRYRQPKVEMDYVISFYEYDWTLNGQ